MNTGQWFELPLTGHKRRTARQIAMIVAGVFAAAGLLWVFATDVLLYTLTADPVLTARIETAKGWIFVALATLLLYGVTLRMASHVTHARDVLATIVDSIADGVLVLGPDRTIVHANPAAVRMLRCGHASELIGMGGAAFARRFRVSYPDGSLVQPERLVSQRVFDEEGPLHYKAVLQPPGGAELILSCTAAAVRQTGSGSSKLVVSVMHDITKPENRERDRDRFFAAAAHSLKTPVAVIKTSAHILSQGAPRALWRSGAAVDRQCTRIDRIIQNLLVLARAHSGTLRLYARELELAPLVKSVALEMTDTSFRHLLRTELGKAPPVHGDPERLAMVLRNVLDEAFGASAPGTLVTVMLKGQPAEADIGVRYQSAPEESPRGARDDWSIARCVASVIVDAHGGTVSGGRSNGATTIWIRLPGRASRPSSLEVPSSISSRSEECP